jgi:hypothetical protein
MNSQDLKLWRYLSLPKFMSLLEEKALYFTRADRFEDPLEGSYLSDQDPMGEYVRYIAKGKATRDSEEEFDIKVIGGQPIRTLAESLRKFTIVNCWHINEHESDAMWKLYLDSAEGVAIQSSLDRLNRAFGGKPNYNIVIRPVVYLDYDKNEPPSTNALEPFFYKRKAYEHEQELRALIPFFHPNGKEVDHGAMIPVDLDQLIELVHVSPKAQSWFAVLIEKLLCRYNLDKPVKHSTLLRRKS